MPAMRPGVPRRLVGAEIGAQRREQVGGGALGGLEVHSCAELGFWIGQGGQVCGSHARLAPHEPGFLPAVHPCAFG